MSRVKGTNTFETTVQQVSAEIKNPTCFTIYYFGSTIESNNLINLKKALDLLKDQGIELLFDEDELNFRVCSICGEYMDEGYVYNSGEKYYCSDECLHQDFTPEQWKEECDTNEDTTYWTTWW